MDFTSGVSTEEELRSLIGYPSDLVQNKVIPHLDEHCRGFISRSPLLLLSTADNNGRCDVSPRGDSAGSVYVLDDTHLIIPERPGNRKIDSMRNILSNPHIGLIFMIPGLEETLRVNGSARLVRDKDLLISMESHGHVPILGIGVTVEECFIHCAKAFKRSKVWDPESWPHANELPNVPKMLADHAKLPGMDTKQVANSLEDSYKNRLY
ncbi:pyridoxamine 5'-phosphate oxidase family protein [Alicyclobacillus sp. SO9]|uniref:pyridoxamine 5'-phosphate oxidase family protein n=1 Tax=Alicyclobacillus sp. SO9 TaxID=2665646 RepID=UPI0018E73A09|nr:pyridoxamine 5'-phosphate oxidase family protein [Alicyclobacillus sp. SO9]QQE79127.1 pyridoxamine 5'-phosphate oxidase family protein [Alicyclobacillus sp. SO9]